MDGSGLRSCPVEGLMTLMSQGSGFGSTDSVNNLEFSPSKSCSH
jgi:hypothetical protein